MLVRPLLGLHRDRIEAFCRRQGLAWQSDSTNLDVEYRRNFIRRELLPLLRSRLNERADDALLRLAAAAEEVEEYLLAQAMAVLGRATKEEGEPKTVLDRAALSDQPRIIRIYVLRAAMERLGVPMRTLAAQRLAELADLVDPDGPAAVALPGDYLARREGEAILITAPGAAETARTDPVGPSVPLALPGATALADGRRILCRIEPLDKAAFDAHRRRHRAGTEMLDADQVRGKLTARPRREGDVFLPMGSPGRQSVSDFLTNQKTPADLRRGVLAICDDLGIVYLAPLRIDDRVKITRNTRRILVIEVVQAL
jgi:tRNA(Ile)-lysidine synthase